MIVELNKPYIIGAFPGAENLNKGNDEFFTLQNAEMSYVKDGAIHKTDDETKVSAVSKTFTHQTKLMQAIVFYIGDQKEVVKAKVQVRATVSKYAPKQKPKGGTFTEDLKS